MRIVYNISEPQVKNIVKMEHEVSYIDAQKLYIPYAGNSICIKEALAIRFSTLHTIRIILLHNYSSDI